MESKVSDSSMNFLEEMDVNGIQGLEYGPVCSSLSASLERIWWVSMLNAPHHPSGITELLGQPRRCLIKAYQTEGDFTYLLSPEHIACNQTHWPMDLKHSFFSRNENT
ncbi:Fibrillin-2 [Manis javanica]|nr:Fibrillin-2 [Manis javanica]